MTEALDRDLETLAAAKTAWARYPIEAKIAVLRAVRSRVAAVAEPWVAAAVRAKGLDPASSLTGEEWMTGPWAVIYAINRYLRTLEHIDRTGGVRIPRRRFRRRRDGRLALRVFPNDLYDRLLLTGISAEVWFGYEATHKSVTAAAAPFYKEVRPEGSVALVLGAGNVASIPALDALYQLFCEGAVCMLKLNPVNAYLGPFLERAFSPLVDAGYLRFAYGGADVGEYLCAHTAVEAIHVTGSAATYDAIVRGSAANKRVTAELGNVSPTIVVPGPSWSPNDFRFQAEHVATQRLHNAGFNCVAAQVLILPAQWDGTARFKEELVAAFDRAQNRPAYYPGAGNRRARALSSSGGRLLHENIVEIDPAVESAAIFREEAFCSVLGCVELPGEGAAYIRDAVRFANERLSGTLGANLIVHPRTERAMPREIDAAIARLRYGCVGVNAWTGVGFFLAETPWGAYSAGTRDDARGGMGFVHNALFLTGAEKSVVRAPFSPYPKPPWFIGNRMQAETARRLCAFETAKTPLNAARVAAAALRA